MRHHPHLYELNARVFLARLSEKHRRILTLATIPEEEWQFLASKGFDLVWLMGVWERSPGARHRALLDPYLRQEYDSALPGWTEEDVAGSPYAIYAYELDHALGAPEELPQLKARLNHLGLRLMLDFVPNHLALDHPWTLSNPHRFVRGSEKDFRSHPDWFFSPNGRIYLAHAKDPNFPPWTDSVQVNFRSPDLREALINELLRISEVADGVRCDMAMLALNHVFKEIWGNTVKDGVEPQTEFWSEAISRVKRFHPDFLFLAEAYWGLERELQSLGFDFTYDKVFYDLLRFSTPKEIRSHLAIDNAYQRHSARFIENHDEPRAVGAFGLQRSLAAVVVMATSPGLRFFHDGQLEGRSIRIPIQLVREPEEPANHEIIKFYDRLLAICSAPAFHEGEWIQGEARQKSAAPETHLNLLSSFWRYGQQLKLVVVNYSPNPAQGWLKLPLQFKTAERIVLLDEWTGLTAIYNAKGVQNQGLHMDLGPWQARMMDIRAAQ